MIKIKVCQYNNHSMCNRKSPQTTKIYQMAKETSFAIQKTTYVGHVLISVICYTRAVGDCLIRPFASISECLNRKSVTGYQIWRLQIVFEAINEEKLLWPILGCKVGQGDPTVMKLSWCVAVPTRCIYQVSNWYLKACWKKKSRKLFAGWELY